MTDKQQAELLEKLGGKRGAQSLAGILEDFSSVEDALKTMEGAAGSSEKEMGIIRESLDFKVNRLKETWVGFLQDMIDRGTLGDIVDGITSISKAVINLTEYLGPLQTILMSIGAIWGSKKLG